MKLVEILDSSDKWCKHVYVTYRFGVIHQRCLIGALQYKLTGDNALVLDSVDVRNFIDAETLLEEICGASVSTFSVLTFNDSSSFEEVYAVAAEFDRRWALLGHE